MSINSRWIPFDPDRMRAAARVLMSTRKRAMDQVISCGNFTETDAMSAIRSELSKDVSSALMLVNGTEVLGYAVATVSEDPVWGRSGWLNPGAFAVRSACDSALPELYALIGRDWLDKKILDHKVFTYGADGNPPDEWLNLGFARQQTYAILNLDARTEKVGHTAPRGLRIRPARSGDAGQISSFSRCIASYQSAGPCFAPAPEEYLQALDDGFSGLLGDDEAVILVAELEGRLAGVVILYPATRPGLMIPEGGTELSVAAVKPEYRGNGVGTCLAQAAFAHQRDKGCTCILTDWRCANPLSNRLWTGLGFQPVGHRLFRRLDPLCLA